MGSAGFISSTVPDAPLTIHSTMMGTFSGSMLVFRRTQRAQYPLIQEYTLNHNTEALELKVYN